MSEGVAELKDQIARLQADKLAWSRVADDLVKAKADAEKERDVFRAYESHLKNTIDGLTAERDEALRASETDASDVLKMRERVAGLDHVISTVSRAVGFTGPAERLAEAVESAMDLSRKTLAECQRATRERDAAVTRCAALDAECKSAYEGIAMFTEQLSAAVADNAALLDDMSEIVRLLSGTPDWDPALRVARGAMGAGRRGAALLERLANSERELEMVRKVADRVLERVKRLEEELAESERELVLWQTHLSPLTPEDAKACIEELREHQTRCTDASCARCRAGNPCH